MNGGLSMVEMKSGYKMTEVGVIPEDWEVKELSSISAIKSGKRLPKGSLVTSSKTPYPYIRVIDMNMGYLNLSNIMYVPENVQPMISKYIISKNDVYISVAGTLGLVGKIPEELDGANLTENANRITEIQCNRDYLMYYMMSPLIQNVIEAERTIGAQPKLALQRIRDFYIVLPRDNREQTAIAAALSDVDSLISALTKKIEKKKAIKQGLMQQLLTGKKRLPGYKGLALVKNEKMEYPGDWDVVKLGDLCRIITKQTGFDYSATIKPSLRTSRGLGVLPFIQNKDFEGYKINFNTDFYIPKDVAMHFPQILLDEPSLLVSISGRIGNVGYYLSSKLAFIGGAICVAKFWKKEYIPWVMLYLQSSKGQNEIFMNEKAGAQHNITVEAIRNFRIPMPSMSEQTAIANILSDCDSEIAALEEKRDKYKEIKQGMMQQLLTGKIRLIK